MGWYKLGADGGQQTTLRHQQGSGSAAQGLTTLKMGWCKLGADEGAQALADLLMFNTTLASVDLRGNGLGDAGARGALDPRGCRVSGRVTRPLPALNAGGQPWSKRWRCSGVRTSAAKNKIRAGRSWPSRHCPRRSRRKQTASSFASARERLQLLKGFAPLLQVFAVCAL